MKVKNFKEYIKKVINNNMRYVPCQEIKIENDIIIKYKINNQEFKNIDPSYANPSIHYHFFKAIYIVINKINFYKSLSEIRKDDLIKIGNYVYPKSIEKILKKY